MTWKSFDDWWATRALSDANAPMALMRQAIREECELAWKEARREYVPHEPSTKEECRKRIDELHAEIKRIAWIAEGSPSYRNCK